MEPIDALSAKPDLRQMNRMLCRNRRRPAGSLPRSKPPPARHRHGALSARRGNCFHFIAGQPTGAIRCDVQISSVGLPVSSRLDLTVTLSRSRVAAVTVKYATANGTAVV